MTHYASVKVDFDPETLSRLITESVDVETSYRMHEALKEYCEPFVPSESGTLSEGATVTPEYVQYQGPYAHYMYTGIVYGPTQYALVRSGDEMFPVFWSTPGEAKRPTGALLNYNPPIVYPSVMDFSLGVMPYPHPLNHPLATHHWDRAMMTVYGDEFTKQIAKILLERLNEND